MTDLVWFRNDETLNAAYQLLDRAVVEGRADDEVLPGTSYARLLEDVAAFGGVLRGFGIGPGDAVRIGDNGEAHQVVAVLAAARIGAVAVLADETGLLTVADDQVAPPGEDPGPWEVLMRSGRTDPAPAAELAPDAPSLRLGDGTPRDTLAQALRLAAARARTPLAPGDLLDVLTGP